MDYLCINCFHVNCISVCLQCKRFYLNDCDDLQDLYVDPDKMEKEAG